MVFWGHVRLHPPQVSRYGKAAPKESTWAHTLRVAWPFFSITLRNTLGGLKQFGTFMQTTRLPTLCVRTESLSGTIAHTISATLQFPRVLKKMTGPGRLRFPLRLLHDRKVGQLN